MPEHSKSKSPLSLAISPPNRAPFSSLQGSSQPRCSLRPPSLPIRLRRRSPRQPPSRSSSSSPPPPSAPPSGVESEAPPKRRKVEVGFQRSPYYTIRETVANLRGCVLQVCQGTESRKKDAAVEILKEMKDVMELSKKARLGLSSAAEPVKLFEKPAAKAPEDKPAGNVPSAEKSQVPPTSLAGNFVHSIGGDLPIKPDNSDTAAHMLLVETKKGLKPSKTTDHTKQQGGLPRGSYVIGGSPIGWNFLMWPGCKAVYYV